LPARNFLYAFIPESQNPGNNTHLVRCDSGGESTPTRKHLIIPVNTAVRPGAMAHWNLSEPQAGYMPDGGAVFSSGGKVTGGVTTSGGAGAGVGVGATAVG
jgi:hypothetical protein